LHQGQYHKESQQGASVDADNRIKAGVDIHLQQENNILTPVLKQEKVIFTPALFKEQVPLFFIMRRASLAQSCQMSLSFILAINV